jgi:hypothetical protein
MDPRSQYAEVPSGRPEEVSVSLDGGSVPTDVNTLPHPSDIHPGSSEPHEQPSLEGDFYHKPLEQVEKIGLPFKIHVSVGLGVTVLCFFSTFEQTFQNNFFFVFVDFEKVFFFVSRRECSNLTRFPS